MRAGHERSQECLPPKKRELPTASAGTEVGRAGIVQASGEGTEWAQTALCYGLDEAMEAVAELPVDQYGMLYKVAVPPATFSPPGLHPMVNVTPLPPAFSVTSPIIQHSGVPYPSVHYRQITPTSLQLIGLHYTVPYSVLPSILPSPLLSSSTNLTASHVPHFVPYASFFMEETTPSLQTTSTHTFSKFTSAVSPGQMQHHAGTQLLDTAPGRIPVYYQMSRFPPGYSTHETPTAGGSPESLQKDSQLNSEVAAANGRQGHPEHNVLRRTSEAVDSASSKAEDCLPGAAAGCVVDGQFLSGYRTVGTEDSVPAHKSTPDTDLEVQRVVGVLASQDYHILTAQRKEDLSPLNLCHKPRHPDQQGESNNMLRNTVERAAAEKSQSRSPYVMCPEELVRQRYLTKGMVIANGKPVLVAIGSEPIRSSISETLVGWSSDAQAQGSVLERDPAQLQPPSSSHVSSHFMKGAIIQLATGELKRVEDLQTQDFVRSAEVSGGLKIDSSTVVDIQESQWPGLVALHFVVGEQQSKVSIDVPPEHPFFVYGQGWSSCSPGQTAQLFALPCHRLQVGDVCISVSLQSMNGISTSQANYAPTDQLLSTRETAERTAQGSREPSDRAAERKSHTDRDSATTQNSHAEPSQPETGSQHSWTAPGFQRYSVLAEELRPSLLRPSFIPQEVKLSIEGRSNTGK